MKKSLILLVALFIGLKASALLVFESVGDMNHFWDTNGRYQEKAYFHRCYGF